MPYLTVRQREMLALTIEADVCINLTPSVSHAAWTVRAGHDGGIEREFYEATGDRLLRLGLIELAPDSIPPFVRERGDPLVIRRYKPTERGKEVALIEEWKTAG
jgi:hypothetical protein